MVRGSRIVRLLPFFLLLAFVLIAGSACEVFSSPQNTFAPAGEAAHDQRNDFLFVMWPALVILIGVWVGVVVLAVKYRRKKGDTGLPRQIHGNTPLELTWTIIPAIMMAVVAVPTVIGIRELAADAAPDAVKVQVTGVQWAWLFEYPDIDAGGQPLSTTPGELRIPVNRDVDVHLRSQDVNHSFWVPKLAGKTDAIPNHANRMWIRASQTGEFAGQCAEFCGLDHAKMRFKVIVMTQAAFDDWVAAQQQAAIAAQQGEPRLGLASDGE